MQNGIVKTAPSPASLTIIKVVGVSILITLSALFIYFNHRFFNWLFKEKAKKYWWVFVLTTLFPFIVLLVLYQLLFGN